MLFPVKIVKHFRLVLTAITLLFVVGLNNREVTTFAPAPEAKTGQQINKSAADRNGTVKQKISFEATSSFVVLQLAVVPEFLQVSFIKPLFLHLSPTCLSGLVTGFFKIFLSTAIQANAP
ncbi:MAG: hypothetical protein JWQ14_1056 [Adhaeribacter sp.]|nr:hypothetical protein [Adhaeribacter sp.]